jgi:hypothetical protein
MLFPPSENKPSPKLMVLPLAVPWNVSLEKVRFDELWKFAPYVVPAEEKLMLENVILLSL